jgi:enoyl-CoA hydratase/carnithine racemase
MLGDPIPAARALDWGLVNEVVPSVVRDGRPVPDATSEQARLAVAGRDGWSIDLRPLDAAVDRLCERLLESFPECMRYTKQQTNFLKDFTWHQTIGHGREWLTLHYAAWEPLEGMRAFVDKRAPRYAELRRRAAAGGSSEMPWGAYVRDCAACGAQALPESFDHCGACGAPLAR